MWEPIKQPSKVAATSTGHGRLSETLIPSPVQLCYITLSLSQPVFISKLALGVGVPQNLLEGCSST